MSEEDSKEKVTVKEHWEDYETKVVPKTAGDTQRRETKRAFYVGVSAMRNIMDAVATDELTEDEAVEILQMVDRELEAFSMSVVEGEE